MKKSVVILGLFAAAGMLAQGPGPGLGGGRQGGLGMGPAMAGGFAGAGPGMGGAAARTVTGAPYSAVEVTETQQVLSGGNAISRKVQSNVYRDNLGRVRTETTMQFRGQGTGQTPRMIVSIHDPVAGVTRELDPQAKTAREIALPAARTGAGAAPAGRANAAARQAPQADANAVTETLAMQTINGVQATGTRVTRTIPAGQVGNAQAIQIVREVWTSADLKVPVMIKSSDPRFGTTTTQLTNITRSEPDASLFQIPAGYTTTTVNGRAGARGAGGAVR